MNGRERGGEGKCYEANTMKTQSFVEFVKFYDRNVRFKHTVTHSQRT